ncbi:unnamed protein product [Acanthoscelides obtectus]|uniref:Putative nuclease HARBI1 n=1 Tax=Acanthoscelides obtectus TaxID=200917 RepID=A0A9P0QC97_ACAOB|nr:unnamed protein product [Acanthoscelides obtectus]CAK1672329.1 Putative nuclease HARBI1 [Acanthoscelides obtectus]
MLPYRKVHNLKCLNYFITYYFLPETNETRGGALSRKYIEIFLRYISDPGFQSGVANDFGIERTTVCKTVDYVVQKIMEKAGQWILFPTTERDLNEAKTSWMAKYRIPTVIGPLDCTHIQVKKSDEQFGGEYINGKNVASLNVQMTCYAMEMITSIDKQWPGSVHDGRIWRQSAVQQKLARFQENACLLGDSGYGISPWLLTT